MAIANGTLDTQTEQVQARCARDAGYLRLIMQGGPAYPGNLPVALAAAGGLRVHPICGELPPGLDPAVETALAMAARGR